MVTKLENLELMKISKEEDLKFAIWNIYPLKAPGPNRFFGVFYPNHQVMVKTRMIKFVQECLKLGSTSITTNKTFIIPILKTKQPQGFDQFRPISLYNFAYKVMIKILAMKMKKIMGKLVSCN